MDLLVRRVDDYIFLIGAADNQTVPKASPHSVNDVVMQIPEDFKVNADGIKPFWPDDERATAMIGVLPGGLV